MKVKHQLELDVLRQRVADLEQQLAFERASRQTPTTATHQSLLAAIVESSDDAIISKDLNGIIRSWNRGAERLFGYTADGIIGQPVTTLAVPERVEEISGILERIRRGERVEHYETKRRTKAGRVLDISLTVAPIRDAAGQIVGASKIARDITEQIYAKELQQRLAAIVESSDDVIISKDLNGTIRSWNRGAERLFGYTADEAIGQPISMLAAPERVEEIPDILERIRRGERVDHYQTRRRTKDGRLLTISLTVSPIRDASGTIIGASKVARDITEQTQAAEMRERLAAIVESSDDAIISKDLNGIIRSWNRGAERLFGYTADEIIGQPVTTLAVPERVEEISGILERIRRGERVEHYETKRRTKAGRVLDISLTVSPIRDAAGQIVGASKIARDITPWKQAELERERALAREQDTRKVLEQTNAELRRANEDLEQFAYAASHDLKEPLRMVSIYSQMLQREYQGKLNGRAEEYLGYAVKGARRMEILIEDLLAYTRAVVIKDQVVPLVSASSVLADALDNLRTTIQDTGARIQSEPLPSLRIPAVNLLQLLQNLVGNALKYRSDACPQIRIWAEADPEPSMWRLYARDNGIGIGPDYTEQIFGIFKRLHTGDEYEGTGIGLAICHKIVERYGGRIWVESEGEGFGSTFCFTLPGEAVPARASAADLVG